MALKNKTALPGKKHLDSLKKNLQDSYTGEDVRLNESRSSGLKRENTTDLCMKQAFTKKQHQELNFIGSCDPRGLDKSLASWKLNLFSEETWMSKASNGINKKKNPGSTENLIKTHNKNY